MEDIKTQNNNGLCYLQLDDLKIGDVYSYVSGRGNLWHYVVSFLHKRMGHSFATIIFADGYADTISTNSVKNDKFIKNIKDWTLIKSEYKDEVERYIKKDGE